MNEAFLWLAFRSGRADCVAAFGGSGDPVRPAFARGGCRVCRGRGCRRSCLPALRDAWRDDAGSGERVASAAVRRVRADVQRADPHLAGRTAPHAALACVRAVAERA